MEANYEDRRWWLSLVWDGWCVIGIWGHGIWYLVRWYLVSGIWGHGIWYMVSIQNLIFDICNIYCQWIQDEYEQAKLVGIQRRAWIWFPQPALLSGTAIYLIHILNQAKNLIRSYIWYHTWYLELCTNNLPYYKEIYNWKLGQNVPGKILHIIHHLPGHTFTTNHSILNHGNTNTNFSTKGTGRSEDHPKQSYSSLPGKKVTQVYQKWNMYFITNASQISC